MPLEMILTLGLASATISVTVGQSKVFKWLRAALSEVPFLGELVACPYCLGHWVSAVLLLASTGGHLTLVGGVVMWLAATAISAIVSGLIGLLLK